MLAYQHAYHAGNIADVHKHLTLFALRFRLVEKTSAITWVDTHAGRGLYPIDANETQRGGEYRDGILPLWAQRESFPQDELIHSWLHQLSLLNPAGQLSLYPGSPWWIESGMRPNDRAEFYELHPGEHAHLENSASSTMHKGIRRHFGDGIDGLISHLPATTPRLCVLIDPSYEIKSDYIRMAEALAAIAHKVRHAVVAIWYPLLPEGRHHDLLDRIRQLPLRKILQSELIYKKPSDGRGMYGSGMLIFNPPWQLDETLGKAVGELATFYGGTSSLKWCVPE